MGVYQMFGRGGGIPNGGIMKPPPGAPAAWMPYARVKDAKAVAALDCCQRRQDRQRSNGSARRRLDREGMDPQGAMFSVHSLKPAAPKAAPTSAKASAGKPAKKAKKAVKKAAPKKAKAKPVKKSKERSPRRSPRRRKKKSAKPAKKKAKKAAKRKK